MYYGNAIRQIANVIRDASNNLRERLDKIENALKDLVASIYAANESYTQNQQIESRRNEEISTQDEISEKDRNRRDNRNYSVQQSIRSATWLAAVGAIIYGAIAAVQTKEMHEATIVAIGSTNTAKEALYLDQRPWVGVESVTPKHFLKTIIGSFQMETTFVLRNYGKSPAERVEIRPKLEIMEPDNRHDVACEASYAQTDSGYSILPTQPLELTYGINVQQAEIEAALKKQRTDRNLFFKIIGCVLYREMGDTGKTHHTPFMYTLQIKDNRYYINADMTSVPDNLLEMKKLTIYSGPSD